MKSTSKNENSTQYEVDFYNWTQRTAELIAEGRLSEVDRERVAEEISDMGKRDRRELRSPAIMLIMHLLKWQMQPKLRNKSTWLATIDEQRTQIRLLLEDSPSLRNLIDNELPLHFMRALYSAEKETGIRSSETERPFTSHEIFSDRFLPQ
jgi:hypothetical protein